jgi:hypothetical protein
VLRARVEAGSLADGAVHVGDGPAAAANDVVVVVADPRLESGRATGRLDPPGQTGAGQRAEDVVHGLGGDRVEPFADLAGDLVDLQMTTLGEHIQYGHPRPGDTQTVRAQQLLTRRHEHHDNTPCRATQGPTVRPVRHGRGPCAFLGAE